MKQNGKILAVVHEKLSGDFIRQAAQIAEANKSRLEVLVVHPAFPPQAAELFENYKASAEAEIVKRLSEFGEGTKVKIHFDSHKPFEVTVIRHVLRGEHDLALKQADAVLEGGKQDRGFKSLDMALLRKCPCTVMLVRESAPSEKPLVVVAVDPITEDAVGHDLNLKLLKEAESFAEISGGTLRIISCWRLEYEDFLRNSPFANMQDEAVNQVKEAEKKRQTDALGKLLSEAGVEYSPDTVIQQEGKAEDGIPAYVDKNKVDYLIMGTVARTGIEGFITGNTAENILQNLSCSMIAVKPGGFVSPVKAYK